MVCHELLFNKKYVAAIYTGRCRYVIFARSISNLDDNPGFAPRPRRILQIICAWYMPRFLNKFSLGIQVAALSLSLPPSLSLNLSPSLRLSLSLFLARII